MSNRMTLAEINTLDRQAFVDKFGGVFEHSPWIAEQAWDARPFADLDALHAAMVDIELKADRDRQLVLIRAHPELAGKAAAEGTLTRESTAEQASAGLNRCTPEELAEIATLNQAYGDKFGFPFIMAVKGRSKFEILDAFRERLNNSADMEFTRALGEIAKIARIRLNDLVEQEQ